MAFKLYLDCMVKFNPEKGDVETAVAHDIKKVTAKRV